MGKNKMPWVRSKLECEASEIRVPKKAVVESMLRQANVLSCKYDEIKKGYHCTMLDGTKWESSDGEVWSQVKKPVPPATGSNVKPALAKESPILNPFIFPTEEWKQARENVIENRVRDYNIGDSDYAKHKIQPWDIWIEYKLNPFDADIIKRVLRHKKTDSRKMDYEKIIHICQERIRQIDEGNDVWEDKND